MRNREIMGREELDKLRVLDDFLQNQIWFTDVGALRRLTGVTIKVEPSGYLAVIKAVTAEGPEVAFMGFSQIDKLR